MKKAIPALVVLLLALLACGAPARTEAPDPHVTAPPTADPRLWYRVRGEAKSDQAWGVDTDSAGNIYTAGYYQSPASALFYDMVIYKFAPDGSELWRTQWGGDLEEKAFVVWVEEPVVYVGGTQHTSAAFEEADMAVLALDMATGDLLWSFTWGQGFGYEEVDGLVAEGDFLYVSGWTTGETSSGDIAVLKLNRSDGSLVWARTWGSDGFDSADGQLSLLGDAIYVSGRYAGQNMLFGGQALLVAFDQTSGDYLRHTLWGSTFFSDGLGSTTDRTSIYVTGLSIENANGQIFLLKYDRELNLLWAQLWGGTGSESARVAELDPDGNILVAGNTFSYGAGKSDVVLLSFRPQDGSLNWYRTWGGPQNDACQGLALFGDFAYIVGSTENASQGMNDALLLTADWRSGILPQP
jgi:hypothetical protein